MVQKFALTVDDLVASGRNLAVERSPAGNLPVMHGHFSHQQLVDGLEVTHADCVSTSPLVFTEEAPGAVSISLNLAGRRVIQLRGQRVASLSAGRVCAVTTSEGTRIREWWDQNQRANTVGLSVEPLLLRELPELDEEGFAALAKLSSERDEVRLRAASDALLFIAQQLIGPPRHGALQSVYNRGMALAFMAEAAALLGAQDTPTGPRAPARCRQRQLADLYHALEECPFEVPDVAAVARTLGLTERRLRAAFVAEYGVTLATHLRVSRLAHAHELLQDGRLSIGEIAYQCGYSNTANFSNAFRNQFGYTPASVRIV